MSFEDPISELMTIVGTCFEPECLEFLNCLSEKGINIVLDFYSGYIVRDSQGKLKVAAAYVTWYGEIPVVRMSLEIYKNLPREHLYSLLIHEIYGHICRSGYEIDARARTENLLKVLELPSLEEVDKEIKMIVKKLGIKYTDFRIKDEDLEEWEQA